MGKLIRWGQPNQTNVVRPGEWIVPQPEAAEPIDIRLAFWALAPEVIAGDTMKGVLVGDGDLTTTVATTQYCADDNGVYNLFGVNKPVWSGGIASLTGGPGTEVLEVKASPDPAEAPYLQYYPAATNQQLHSRDYADVYWTKTAGISIAADIIGLDGATNGGYTLTSQGASDSSLMYRMGFNGGSPTSTEILWYRKSDSTSTEASFKTRSATGEVFFNPQTAVITDASQALDAEIIDFGDVVKLLVQMNANPSNQSFGVRPSVANTSSVTLGLLQVESHENKTIAEVRGLGPIFTTTGSVSTVALAYDNNVANHAESGCYYMEIIKDGQGAILDGFLSVISPNYQLDDGLVVVTQTWTDNTAQKLGIAFADGQMAVNVDGVWGTDGVFAGTLLNGALDYFRSGLISSRLRNVRRYDETDYTEAKSIIDGLMA